MRSMVEGRRVAPVEVSPPPAFGCSPSPAKAGEEIQLRYFAGNSFFSAATFGTSWARM